MVSYKALNTIGKSSKASHTKLENATYEFVNELKINEALSLRIIILYLLFFIFAWCYNDSPMAKAIGESKCMFLGLIYS